MGLCPSRWWCIAFVYTGRTSAYGIISVTSPSWTAWPSVPDWTDGVTALCCRDGVPNELLVGTKQGQVHRVVWSFPITGGTNDSTRDGTSATFVSERLTDNDDESCAPSRPAPIFALACDDQQQFLFAGGGNGYTTVWQQRFVQRQRQVPVPNGSPVATPSWRWHQRLGPHTGWVKDLLYIPSTQTLHSIGCNRIERWQRSDTIWWTHNQTVSIESSQLASTLSSDLLCLGAVGTEETSTWFVSGGVDGRLHLWDANRGDRLPTASIAAHDGRVHAAVVEPRSGILATASHDGSIQLWELALSTLTPTSLRRLATWVVPDGVSRVTALTWYNDNGTYTPSQLVVGTHRGRVYVLSVEQYGSKATRVEVIVTNSYRLREEPVVHALAVIGEAPSRFVVGHSRGMTILPIRTTAKEIDNL